MALIDVSEVLTDPDFLSSLLCERRGVTVGNDGVSRVVPVRHRFSGAVTNDRGDVLQRQAAGERIEGSITVHTRFRLNDGKAGTTADIVTFGGRAYTVSNVNDYSHFGRGFVAATCDLIPLSG